MKRALKLSAEENLRLAYEQLQQVSKELAALKKKFPSSKDLLKRDSDVSFFVLDKTYYKLSFLDVKTTAWGLKKDRIKSIPLRDVDWFTRNYQLIAYSPNSKQMVSISGLLGKQQDVLYLMQEKGYRFINNSAENYLQVAKSCNACIHQRRCPVAIKTSRMCPAFDIIKKGETKLSFYQSEYTKLTTIEIEN